MEEYNQDELSEAETTNILQEEVVKAEHMMEKMSGEGFEKLMKENELDAMVTLGADAATILAIEGYPALSVPAGYDNNGLPYGLCFGRLEGSEPKLIEIACSLEQAMRIVDLLFRFLLNCTIYIVSKAMVGA
ncbi:probable amidase At4g34880 [Syzygium oleosum]|uniref:probable amidase At4g34880 n=1 Tax=Syzygium oleosum TaxID=219896 RepID=UPI0024BAA344|nr:probable amidase At4g34880 [Syzygium oleosum]